MFQWAITMITHKSVCDCLLRQDSRHSLSLSLSLSKSSIRRPSWSADWSNFSLFSPSKLRNKSMKKALTCLTCQHSVILWTFVTVNFSQQNSTKKKWNFLAKILRRLNLMGCLTSRGSQRFAFCHLDDSWTNFFGGLLVHSPAPFDKVLDFVRKVEFIAADHCSSENGRF